MSRALLPAAPSLPRCPAARIATPATERGLADIAGPMTGNQLERFARAHRKVTSADDATARVRRRLAWRFEDDGSLAGSFRLPPLQGAVLLKALRAAAGDLDHPRGEQDGDVSAETSAAGQPVVRTSSSLADGLVAVAEAFLAGKVAGAEDPEVYQVIVHAGTGALAASDQAGVPAETSAPTAPAPVPGYPPDPARCHVDDGPAISVGTAQMPGCTAALSWMARGRDGAVLDLGRRRRRPSAPLRRAARERDKCRCRFPGCQSRRIDLHHLVYWANGGRTSLDNLVSLCRYHHMLIHDRGYLIAAEPSARPGGGFAFYRPDGTPLPASPALPPPDGKLEDTHDTGITPETIIPPWYGERLNLDDAIYICLANARTPEEKQRNQADDPELFRPRKWVVELSDGIRAIREHLAEREAAMS